MLGKWSIDEVCFQWIRDNLKKGSTILELGSGFGTGQLARYYTMYSIEDNEKYIGKYDSTYIHAPLKNYEGYKWYDTDILEEKLPRIPPYQMILIDGPHGEYQRKGFQYNLDLFKLDCIMVFDDINRSINLHQYENVCEKLDKPVQILGELTGINKLFGVII